MRSRHVTKSNGVVVNSPVTKRVEACVRSATSRDACIVWLDRTAIFKVKSSCLSHYHCFFSQPNDPRMLGDCFVCAFRTHSSACFVTGQFVKLPTIMTTTTMMMMMTNLPRLTLPCFFLLLSS